MPVPRTEKEIKGFLGKLQYIIHFITRLTNICEPIFRLLRKNQPTVWNDVLGVLDDDAHDLMLQEHDSRTPLWSFPHQSVQGCRRSLK